jgi:squalene-hopene/tetraprenyl-beta-curcumene cyclase
MPAGVPHDRLEAACATARQALLAELTPAGYWEGELSTSALSTATAVMALEMLRRNASVEVIDGRSVSGLITGGVNWLAQHQNADGGWGDTVKSLSNISTTMLCRAVFFATGRVASFRSVVDVATRYVDRTGGVPAVVARYGKDRTFSIPILTHCALAGLVDWGEVTPLPFELACIPPRFYKTARLPVVSYALPALIAIGQVRHWHRPTWNPIMRVVRRLARAPSLRVLERIQPTSGGFLEATPLTSFVTMSLAAMGLGTHPVAESGIRFIVNSVRENGGWPIDTNLATWVTTLAVNTLQGDLPIESREPICRWLLDQQYKTLHPYTNADPGGWAWTDLPGGVPDADDTPGAMLALLNLHEGSDNTKDGIEEAVLAALSRGTKWLLSLQNRDGGWPTFCRGWGTLPFDRSSADITAHCLRGLRRVVTTIKEGELTVAPEFRRNAVRRAIDRGFAYLASRQRADGAWLPLWFGNQHDANEANPVYGTAKVLAAYSDAEGPGGEIPSRGVAFLRNYQNADGGWGAGPGTPSSIEETALAVETLLEDPGSDDAASRGLTWLLERVEDGSWREPAPIGFYFAKLWYFERLYPLIFTAGALRRACRGTGAMPESV